MLKYTWLFSKLVYLRVFFVQVFEEIFCGEGAAREVGEPFIRREDVRFFENVLFHPAVDESEIAAGDRAFEVDILRHFLDVHRVVGVAEGVARKISEAARPVNVLQNARLVAVGRYAEVLGVKLVPFLRNVGDLYLARADELFHLIADDDVKSVRHLVGFRADERRRDDVHRFIQLALGYVAELVAEQFHELRIDEADIFLAPADDVFVETRNGFVHPV